MNANAHPDLEALRRSEPTPPPRGRGRGARLAVIALVLGVLVTAFAVLRPVLFPAPLVRTVAVLPAAAGDDAPRTAGETLQDVGWLEAHPFPTTVRPLVRGVLDELRVLEGDRVVKDETVIGRLRNLEIENAYEEAQALLSVAEARVRRTRSALAVARSLLEQKLDLRRAVADVEGALAAARAEVLRLEAKQREAEAAVATAEVEVRAQERLKQGGGDTPVAYERAVARRREAQTKVEEMERAIQRAQADVARHEALGRIAREGVEDPRDLAGTVEIATEAHVLAEAEKARAEVAVAIAKRNVDHLTVKAPIDGVVMRLESAPGAVVGPAGEYKEGDESGPGSTSRLNRMTGSLVSLYDPARLQVRVDVLYAQVANIGKGSTISFTVDAIPGKTFEGELDRLVHEADINQNALQVKIRVVDPDPRMRPEMLCRVQFETAEKDVAAGAPGPRVARFRVPDEAVRDGAVFVHDPTEGGRARRVPVRTLSSADGFTLVEGELGISSKVILDAIGDGEKVRIHDER